MNPQDTGKENTNWKDRLDALKFAATIHAPIGNEITSDATLAILNQKDKEGITNMRDNLEQAIMIQDIIYDTHLKRTKTKENKELRTYIEKQKHRLSRLYLISPSMIMILARNQKDNPMLNILGEVPENTINTPEEPEKSPFWQKIKNRLQSEAQE